MTGGVLYRKTGFARIGVSRPRTEACFVLGIMDDILEIAYVADIETYELLYLNESGKRLFGLDDVAGRTCHQALQGLDEPCPFCTNGKLRSDATYTWEHSNPLTGKRYLLKDRLIEWEGRTARIEVAADMTASDADDRGLRYALDAEGMVLHCVDDLYREADLDAASKTMLRTIGERLESDRTYIIEFSEGLANNTYEWCAEGIEPAIDLLQGIDLRIVARWLDLFERGECVILEDLEAIRESSPVEYGLLAQQNIDSLAVAPLEQNGRIIGCIGIDNPPVDRIRNLGPLLRTLAYFYLMTVRRIGDEEELRYLSFHDGLTGLYNRNRFVEDCGRLEAAGEPLGVLYVDVNGLKTINDSFGHLQGDTVLRTCARTMVEELEGAEVYRLGGDEFVALVGGVESDAFEDMRLRLERSFERGEDDLLYVSLGANWSDDPKDVASMLAAADAAMYEQKRLFRIGEVRESRRLAKSESTAARYDGLGAGFEDGVLLDEYNMLMSAMHVSVSKHLFTEKFEVLWANDFYYEMTGYTREEYDELFNGNCGDYFADYPEEYGMLSEVVVSAYEAGEPGYECLMPMPIKGGSRMWIRVVGRFTSETAGGFPVIYATFTCVDDVVQLERERSIAFDAIPGFVARIRMRKNGLKLLYGNDRFVDFFGPVDEAASQALFRENAAMNHDVIKENYPAMRRGESVSLEVVGRSRRGEEASFRLYADCIDWVEGDPVYLALYLDTTEITRQRRLVEEANEKLRMVAYVDPVTGGRNRTSFERDIAETIGANPASTYAFVSIDLQKFKVVNDLFGTCYGDLMLKFLYENFEAHLASDECAARMSADLFSLLLKASDEASIENRLEAMVQDANERIAQTLADNEMARPYLVTMTAGIYVVDDPSLPIVQIQDRANMARKKTVALTEGGAASGRVCACRFYRNDDNVRLAAEKDTENRMAGALEAGEFVVYLQPKVDLRSRTVAGAEALVRWIDPDRGIVPPNDFIPLFEKNGFVVELDLYVFEQVCALLSGWMHAGVTPVPVSVNFSRVHLSDPLFLERFEAIRKAYGVPASLIELELTETLVFENPQLLASVIDRLHEAGYSCSMDDFGSGYSSLNVLKDLSVDVLKLDRVFFDAFDSAGSRCSDVVDVVIDLARRLDMKTVAEGVETEEQAAFLAEAGCDMVQGYLFSRPVPVSDFERLAFGDEVRAG